MALRVDAVGSSLEALKGDYLGRWFTALMKERSDVVTSALLPYPPECARVAPCWEPANAAGMYTLDLRALVSWQLEPDSGRCWLAPAPLAADAHLANVLATLAVYSGACASACASASASASALPAHSPLRDGLNRLLTLVPYDVVSLEVWNATVPHWFEALGSQLPAAHLLPIGTILRSVAHSPPQLLT